MNLYMDDLVSLGSHYITTTNGANLNFSENVV